jgi:hypothetical protein
MDASTSDLAVLWAVILVRFVLPLFIPKYPLPAVFACFFVDAADQTVFEAFTHVDLAGYQGYDKALDVYYLSIAMLAILRNWTHHSAVQIGRALFYIRLIGVMAFELTAWRPLLLLFPNTFEYFFIFYEIVRSSWYPARMSTRFFVVAAIVIWVGVKLPQEYWIHIAQLDLTDTVKSIALGASGDVGWNEAAEHKPLMLACLIAVVGGLGAAASWLILRLVRPSEHALRLAADPLPAVIDEAHERDSSIAQGWRLFDLHLLEKVVLVGCITVIFAQVLPGVTASTVQLMSGAGVIVTVNAFLRIRSARAGRSLESATASFIVLALINATIVAVAQWLLRREDGGLDVPATLLFLLLLTLIVTLYDRWHPVFDVRFARSPVGSQPPRE